ncbi:MAG: hypothetical protein OXT74_18440 [Candidatus Poribacteria bacterium]|nr:hypothetical protein [Candidatus Poribacteria bacterium]
MRTPHRTRRNIATQNQKTAKPSLIEADHMINYLTHPNFLYYDTNQLPSQQGGGGGMSTKTYRVIEALARVYPQTLGITNSAQICADIVLIEPLRFTLATEGATHEPQESFDELIRGLKASHSKKILYCSELALMRMQPDLRQQLLEAVDAVTTNCAFQANVFKYAGIYSTHRLCDPIPDEFVANVSFEQRRPRLVATGNVSWEKNAPQLIEVFKRLKDIVERVYIGSSSLWRGASEEGGRRALLEELCSHCDKLIREATTNQIAREFQTSRFGLWVSYHDTFATAAHEMFMSGMLIIAAKHGLSAEIPVYPASGVRKQVDTIKRLASESSDALAEQSQQVAAWACDNVSYEAFHRQLQTIFRAIW